MIFPSHYSPAAIYLYRRTRRNAVGADTGDDGNGVRFNIPLSRLEGVQYSRCLSFATLLSLEFNMGDHHFPETSPARTPPVDGNMNSPSADAAGKAAAELIEHSPDTQLLQVAVIQQDPGWYTLEELASKAREYEKTHNVNPQLSRVYLDYDATVGFGAEDQTKQHPVERADLKRSLVLALGLDPEKDSWSKHRRLFDIA